LCAAPSIFTGEDEVVVNEIWCFVLIVFDESEKHWHLPEEKKKTQCASQKRTRSFSAVTVISLLLSFCVWLGFGITVVDSGWFSVFL